jgi:hypothetical protein
MDHSDPPAIHQIQPAQERTIEEIKAEAQERAERGAYPLIGLDPADVHEALTTVKTRDRDEWAAAWSAVAERYYRAAERSTSVDERRSNYLRAWRLYYFAQWPVSSSAGKRAAYAKALDAFARSAQAFVTPLEVVRIPFERKEIVGYLRLPSAAAKPVPVVLAVSGLDSRKENLAETYSGLLEHGVGFFAVDGPGTGQSPVRVGPTAEGSFASDRLPRFAQRHRSEAHRPAWGELRGLLGSQAGHSRDRSIARRSGPIAANSWFLPAGFYKKFAAGKPRISVRCGARVSGCRR